MAVPYQPQNVAIDQSDGNILIEWDAVLGATGYTVQRSTDGVNFSTLATTALVNQYMDSLPGFNTMFYYQILATNGSGSSVPSSIVQMVAAPPSEMSLYQLKLASRQDADRVDSNFVSDTELANMVRLSCYELYDILITSYEDWFATAYAQIPTNGTTFQYPLPDGATNYLGGVYGGVSGAPAPALYKLAGFDLNVNTSILTPSRVTLLRFDFIKRNQYVYPNSTSTIYGVYNMRYRLMGSNVWIIPTPAGGQNLIMWYSPKMPRLLLNTDTTIIGVSGWLRYVIVRASKYMLDKEEGSDTSRHSQELLFLKQRIQEAAQNRDAGVPDTISETRIDPAYGGTGWGAGGGGQGGWATLFPVSLSHNVGNHLLAHSIFGSQPLLGYIALCISFAYFFHLAKRKSCGGVAFAWARPLFMGLSVFRNFIRNIIKMSSEE